MERNVFLQDLFQDYLLLIPVKKNTLNILVALLGLIRRNLMECQGENIENINESDSNFVPTLVDRYLLPDIHFNGRCLIEK